MLRATFGFQTILIIKQMCLISMFYKVRILTANRRYYKTVIRKVCGEYVLKIPVSFTFHVLRQWKNNTYTFNSNKWKI